MVLHHQPVHRGYGILSLVAVVILLDKNLVALAGDLQSAVLVHILRGHFGRREHALGERRAGAGKACVDANGHRLSPGSERPGCEDCGRGDCREKSRLHDFLPYFLSPSRRERLPAFVNIQQIEPVFPLMSTFDNGWILCNMGEAAVAETAPRRRT